jgi:hypothetical protein
MQREIAKMTNIESLFYENEGALLVEGKQVEPSVSVGKPSKLPSGITSSSSPRQDGSLAIHS